MQPSWQGYCFVVLWAHDNSENWAIDMHKKDLINAVAEESGATKIAAELIIDTVFKAIVTGLKADKEARFVGFGSFVVQTRAARKAYNPRTRAEIDVPAKNVVVFRPGKEFKDAVNAQG